MGNLNEYIDLSNNQSVDLALDDYGPTYDAGSGGLNDPVVQVVPDEARGGGGGSVYCVLGYSYDPDHEGNGDPDFLIHKGAVTADETIMLEGDVRNLSDDSEEDLWVKIGYTVNKAEGVLVGGGTLDSAIIVSANTGGKSPTYNSPTGVLLYFLGTVKNVEGSQSFFGGCGNIMVQICPSGASAFRS